MKIERIINGVVTEFELAPQEIYRAHKEHTRKTAKASYSGEKAYPRGERKKSIDKIIWKKLDSGEYESEDGRFHVLRCWDKIYGNHWQLIDRRQKDADFAVFHYPTLRYCKTIAECRK